MINKIIKDILKTITKWALKQLRNHIDTNDDGIIDEIEVKEFVSEIRELVNNINKIPNKSRKSK